jgi:hypothetical protein
MGLGLSMRSREDILLYLAVKSMGSMLNMTWSPDVGVDLWVCANDRNAKLPQYVNIFLVRHKTFGLAQNILGPVKGQGISDSSKTFVLAPKLNLFNENHLLQVQYNMSIKLLVLLKKCG